MRGVVGLDTAIDVFKTDIIILTPKDIIRIYNLPRLTVYAILNKRGCPLITGGVNEKGRSTRKRYRIEKSAFENFIKTNPSQTII